MCCVPLSAPTSWDHLRPPPWPLTPPFGKHYPNMRHPARRPARWRKEAPPTAVRRSGRGGRGILSKRPVERKPGPGPPLSGRARQARGSASQPPTQLTLTPTRTHQPYGPRASQMGTTLVTVQNWTGGGCLSTCRPVTPPSRVRTPPLVTGFFRRQRLTCQIPQRH